MVKPLEQQSANESLKVRARGHAHDRAREGSVGRGLTPLVPVVPLGNATRSGRP